MAILYCELLISIWIINCRHLVLNFKNVSIINGGTHFCSPVGVCVTGWGGAFIYCTTSARLAQIPPVPQCLENSQMDELSHPPSYINSHKVQWHQTHLPTLPRMKKPCDGDPAHWPQDSNQLSSAGDDSSNKIGHAQIQHFPAISCQTSTCHGALLCSTTHLSDEVTD